MKRPGRARLVLLAAILLVVSLVLLVRIDYDSTRAIWHIDAAGFSFTCLDDRTQGITCWVYWGAQLVGHWPDEPRPATTTPYPTYTPFPTYTPYPTPTRRAPLQEA